MGTKSKIFSWILIVLLVASSLIMIKSAYAQAIKKPSIPEFTAKYVDRSYDIPPTYGVDQYTGKTIITKPGEHIDNRTVEITIKNQPFTTFTDTNGNSICMFYNVRFKGPFGQNWTEMFGVQRTVWYSFSNPVDNFGYMIQTYSSQYTIVEITNPPAQGQMDIQVKALEGYTNRTTVQGHIFMAQVAYTFFGEESEWSNTQTVTIDGASTSTPNPTSPTISTPTSTPYNSTSAPSTNGNQTKVKDSVPLTISLTTFLLVVIALVVIIAVLLLLFYRRHRKTISQNKHKV
jgi:hypothetical protein